MCVMTDIQVPSQLESQPSMSTKDFRNSIQTLSKSSTKNGSLMGGTNVCSFAEAKSAIADYNENNSRGT